MSVCPETLCPPDGYSKLFPIRKREFLDKIKENEELRWDLYEYAAQATPQFNTGILKKGCFRMEIS